MTDPANDLKDFKTTAIATLQDLRPTLEGLRSELKRQRGVFHSHEDFLITEFRDLTRAIDGLTAQLARIT